MKIGCMEGWGGRGRERRGVARLRDAAIGYINLFYIRHRDSARTQKLTCWNHGREEKKKGRGRGENALILYLIIAKKRRGRRRRRIHKRHFGTSHRPIPYFHTTSFMMGAWKKKKRGRGRRTRAQVLDVFSVASPRPPELKEGKGRKGKRRGEERGDHRVKRGARSGKEKRVEKIARPSSTP